MVPLVQKFFGKKIVIAILSLKKIHMTAAAAASLNNRPFYGGYLQNPKISFSSS